MATLNRQFRDLANGIVLQAAKDYREALKGNIVDYKSPEEVIKDCEEFFTSDWCKALTKVNGKYLMEKLRKEYIDECKTRGENNG